MIEIIIAIAAALGVTVTDRCEPVVLTDTVPVVVSETLLDMGWAGKAGDDMEALYAPGC